MTSINFRELPHLPKVPDHFISEILTQANEQLTTITPVFGFDHFKIDPGVQEHMEKEFTDKIFENNIGVRGTEAIKLYPNNAKFAFLTVSKELEDWCFTNISTEAIVNIIYIYSGEFSLPHVDPMRTTAYNYIISTGGDNVRTCYWEPKDEYKHLNITPLAYVPYDKINLIDEAVFQQDNWYQLNVSKIHSVEGIDRTKKRIILTVSFK